MIGYLCIIEFICLKDIYIYVITKSEILAQKIDVTAFV